MEKHHRIVPNSYRFLHQNFRQFPPRSPAKPIKSSTEPHTTMKVSNIEGARSNNTSCGFAETKNGNGARPKHGPFSGRSERRLLRARANAHATRRGGITQRAASWKRRSRPAPPRRGRVSFLFVVVFSSSVCVVRTAEGEGTEARAHLSKGAPGIYGAALGRNWPLRFGVPLQRAGIRRHGRGRVGNGEEDRNSWPSRRARRSCPIRIFPSRHWNYPSRAVRVLPRPGPPRHCVPVPTGAEPQAAARATRAPSHTSPQAPAPQESQAASPLGSAAVLLVAQERRFRLRFPVPAAVTPDGGPRVVSPRQWPCCGPRFDCPG
jgi:hypothetical protein